MSLDKEEAVLKVFWDTKGTKDTRSTQRANFILILCALCVSHCVLCVS